MTERSTKHATFTIERTFAAPQSRVFAAYADAKSKARWFVGPEGWKKSNLKLDFEVGGRESVSGGPPGGPTHYYNAIYQDIYTEQAVFLDGHDDAGSREQGTRSLFDNLAALLEAQ